MVSIPEPLEELSRRISDVSEDSLSKSASEDTLSSDYRRTHDLSDIRQQILRVSTTDYMTVSQLETLLSQTAFTSRLFSLFDTNNAGFLVQQDWIEDLKLAVQTLSLSLELAELIEAISYVVCGDDNIQPQHFHKIISSRGLSRKFLELSGGGASTVSDLMEVIIIITCRQSSCGNDDFVKSVKTTFHQVFGLNKKTITREEFRKITPGRDEFFCGRMFSVLDSDNSGSVSLPELTRLFSRLSKRDSNDAKIEFLFKIYDQNNDQHLTQLEYTDVIRACMKENQMEFNEEEISNLGSAIFEDGLTEGNIAITFADFREQMLREEGLLDNLTSMFNRWILPQKQESRNKRADCSTKLKRWLRFRYFTAEYWQNNSHLSIFILAIFLVNAGLFIQRAVYFKEFRMLDGVTPNPFYMVSRGFGRTLLFNSVFIILPVLRYSISMLRKLGLASVLPLDHNIYIHKLVGVVIFVQGFVHSTMHLCNFALNVQPDPVKFITVQQSYYWDDYPAPFLGYHTPIGCKVIPGPGSNSTCQEISSALPDNLYRTQICVQDCSNGTQYSYADWMLTTTPGVFGMVPGIANITGIFLFIVLTIMFVCSLPVVRRSGHFQIFYFTHMLYCVYFLLLILHAPSFYMWIFLPATFWIAEFIYRVLSSLYGHGKTHISAGVLLPSGVTNLVIQRPHNFKFSPGDWVFVKIPAVAGAEWHPFTISSAPEVEGEFSLHIRGVGGWTKKLYKLFEDEYNRQNQEILVNRQTSRMDSIVGNVKRKFTKSFKIIRERTRHHSDSTFISIINSDNNIINSDNKNIINVTNNGSKVYPIVINVGENEYKENEAMENQNNKLSEDYHIKLGGRVSNNMVVDKEKQRQRISKRAEKLEAMIQCNHDNHLINHDEGEDEILKRTFEPVRYLSQRQRIVRYDSREDGDVEDQKQDVPKHDGGEGGGGGVKKVGRHTLLEKPLEVYIDGPFGSPSSNIYRAEHAVLIGTGIGVTPFASILQSIMHKYCAIKQTCPNCKFQWSEKFQSSLQNLKKVDFFWINRDMRSFEWFVNLLSQLEIEQAVHGGEMDRFLDMHMYVTSALQRTDMRAVSLQLALDILHRREDRDLITGLRSRTNAGRPNWDKIFTKLGEERKGNITVFYCGNPILAKILRAKCEQFGFGFRKEVF